MELDRRQHYIYDILISALAVATAMMLVLDYSSGVHGWQLWAYRGILAVFYTDYFLRFQKAADKRKFMRDNLADLIVLLPLQTLFGWIPFLKLRHLDRLLCLPRLLAILCRPLKKAGRFFNTNGFKYVVFVTGVMVIVGGILIHFAEDMQISDGIWWAFVTMSTVGYGDISPTTFYGRMIAMVLMLLGIGLIGSLTSTLTSYFMKTSGQERENKTLSLIREQVDRFEELSAEEVDDLCVMLKALKDKEIRQKEKAEKDRRKGNALKKSRKAGHPKKKTEG